jgi:cell division protein FtsQ
MNKNSALKEHHYSEYGLRRKNVLLGFSLLVFIALCIGIWHYITHLAIENVNVRGDFKYLSHQEIEKRVGEHLSAGFFELSIHHLQRDLLEHPWVLSAIIQRRWPFTLDIILEERKPVAVFEWFKSQSTPTVAVDDEYLIDENYEMFMPVTKSQSQVSWEVLESLPVVVAKPSKLVSVMHNLEWANQRLKPFDLSVKRLTLSDRDSFELELNRRYRIILGRDEFQQRMKRLFALLPLLEDQVGLARLKRAGQISHSVVNNGKNPLIRIDLRYTQGAAIDFDSA